MNEVSTVSRGDGRQGISITWKRVIGVAFVLPWVVFEVVLQGQKPDLGYAVGVSAAY